MHAFTLYWSPEGRAIAHGVRARSPRAAIRKAPLPYRRRLGEIYAVADSTPSAIVADVPVERCAYCSVDPVNPAHAPYCSAQCGIDADLESRR